jgi:hypothetical protein
MIPTTYLSSGAAANARHEGVERVTSGIESIYAALSHAPARKTLSRGVIGVGTMTAVTLAERALDAAHTGFAAEFIILSAVALLAYASLRAFVVPALRLVVRAVRHLGARLDAQAQEARFLEVAQRDPRIMNEYLAAQSKHNEFVDEHSFRSGNAGARLSVADPLSAVAPWRNHANML